MIDPNPATQDLIQSREQQSYATNSPNSLYSFDITQMDLNFESLAKYGFIYEDIKKRVKLILNEISELRKERKWADIIEIFHPLGKNEPHLVNCALDQPIRQEIAFALCQVGRFDESIEEYEKCLSADPNNYRLHLAVAYVIQNKLLSIKSSKTPIHPKEKKNLLKKAFTCLNKAAELRPDSVTAAYRHGSLYKHFTNDMKSAATYFERAVMNWECLEEEQRKRRHQEFKNYIKSLYNLSSCKLHLKNPREAHHYILKCISKDSETNFISPEIKGFTLGKVLFVLNDLKGALEVLKETRKHAQINGSGEYILELLARTYLRLGYLQEALEVIREVPPKLKRPYIVWTEADILSSMGDFQEAKRLLIKCAERDRKGAHKAYIKLARIEFLEKNYEQVIVTADMADKFHRETYGSPYHEAIFWRIAVLLRTNQIVQASEEFNELKKLNPYYSNLKLLEMELNKELNSVASCDSDIYESSIKASCNAD